MPPSASTSACSTAWAPSRSARTSASPPPRRRRTSRPTSPSFPVCGAASTPSWRSARRNKEVATLFGRVRPIPEIAASNQGLRANAERMALNAPFQGTAADIIKIAMIRLDAALPKAGLKARLVLQVHDELVLEAPAGKSPRFAGWCPRSWRGPPGSRSDWPWTSAPAGTGWKRSDPRGCAPRSSRGREPRDPGLDRHCAPRVILGEPRIFLAGLRYTSRTHATLETSLAPGGTARRGDPLGRGRPGSASRACSDAPVDACAGGCTGPCARGCAGTRDGAAGCARDRSRGAGARGFDRAARSGTRRSSSWRSCRPTIPSVSQPRSRPPFRKSSNFADAAVSVGDYVSVHVDPAGRAMAVRRERDPIPSLSAEELKSLSRWLFSPSRKGARPSRLGRLSHRALHRGPCAEDPPDGLRADHADDTHSHSVSWPSDNDWLESRHPSPPTDATVPIDQVDVAPSRRRRPGPRTRSRGRSRSSSGCGGQGRAHRSRDSPRGQRSCPVVLLPQGHEHVGDSPRADRRGSRRQLERAHALRSDLLLDRDQADRGAAAATGGFGAGSRKQ